MLPANFLLLRSNTRFDTVIVPRNPPCTTLRHVRQTRNTRAHACSNAFSTLPPPTLSHPRLTPRLLSPLQSRATQRQRDDLGPPRNPSEPLNAPGKSNPPVATKPSNVRDSSSWPLVAWRPQKRCCRASEGAGRRDQGGDGDAEVGLGRVPRAGSGRAKTWPFQRPSPG